MALVLVPQSLAYATLAGIPPATGLVVAGVATIAAAPFVSAPLLQTGPTAITSLLTYGSLATIAAVGTPEYVAMAAVLAVLVGLVRVAIGLFQAGEVAYLVSQPVLVGFTGAAALVIVASQVPVVLGVGGIEGDVMGAAARALSDVDAWNVEALALAAATVLVVLGGRRVHRLVPGVLLAAVGGILFARLGGYTGSVIGPVPTALPRPVTDLPVGALPELVVAALVIALVGFSEAAAIARSFGEQGGELWDPDREFISQGVANVASGAFGGFPAGASFSRSGMNRLAGADTAWSGAITGAAALAVIPFAGVLRDLPDAVLAGIIVGAVVGLIDPRPVLELRRYSRQQFVIALTTFVLTIVFAPQIQWAVLVGVVMTIGAHLRRERHLSVQHWIEQATLHLRPIGVLYFGSARQFERQARDLLRLEPDLRRLVVHFDGVGRTDVTGALALRRLFREVRRRGIDLEVADPAPPSEKIIRRVLSEEQDLAVTIWSEKEQ